MERSSVIELNTLRVNDVSPFLELVNIFTSN
jgi:hypothetical protein